MATEMKAFKRFSAAKQAANGQPIIRIGDTYLVGVTIDGGYMTEISLIAPDGHISGNVTVRHLDRLGNANHATASDRYNNVGNWRIWPDQKSLISPEAL